MCHCWLTANKCARYSNDSLSWVQVWSYIYKSSWQIIELLILPIQNNALGRQLSLVRSLIIAYWFWIISYHVSILYNTSIGIRCPNNGAQFNACRLQGYASMHLCNCRIINTAYSIYNWNRVCGHLLMCWSVFRYITK